MTGITRQNIFKLKRSNVSGKMPTTSDLLVGELAVNTQDGFLYSSIANTGGTNTIEFLLYPKSLSCLTTLLK